MKRNYFDIIVGALTIIFSLIFIIQVMKMTNIKISQEFYELFAKFENVEGVTAGTKIKMGGADIGKVNSIEINNDYSITVKLAIKNEIKIPIDSSIKVSTSGFIGGKYLKVSAGGEDKFLNVGEEFEFTESTMDLEDMITRFILDKASNAKK